MCGIAGIFDPRAEQIVLKEIATNMANTLLHRGPDAGGIWASEDIPLSLAHRRLAIQDLSAAGAQPMQSTSGRYVISFNGEIYNFPALARELQALGHKFRGASDTEVLLCAIEQWGLTAALERAQGMFALGVFDTVERTLFLARDRIGEKPLYYGFVNGAFLFASELKAIEAALPHTKLTISSQAVAQLLEYGYISDPDSIYCEIKKVPPGSVVEIPMHEGISSNSRLSATPFWHLQEAFSLGRSSLIENERVALEQLEMLVESIIERQSIADVPVGAFLSGGIDSSLVSAVLQSQRSEPIDTFTIGFDAPEFNEADCARNVANHIGSKHHELIITGSDCLNLIPELPQIYDEPFADSSQIPMWFVSQLASPTVTVCLSGDGGDELFGGYNRYRLGEKMMRVQRRLPKFTRNILASVLAVPSPGMTDSIYQAYNRMAGKKGAASAGLKLAKLAQLLRYDSPAAAYRYLSGYCDRPEMLVNGIRSGSEHQIAASFDDDFLDAAMLWDQRWYLPGDNLVKSDRASMAVSLEMRLPLMDAELVEFAWTIPNSMKIRGSESKWLLRQLLYKYVPRALIDRPKMGFSIPIDRWIRSELRDWADSLLSEEMLESSGVLNAQGVRGVYIEHLKGRANHGNLLWSILMFQSWHQRR